MAKKINLQSWNNVAAYFQPEISYHFTENHKRATRTVIDNQECVENDAVVFVHAVKELRNDPSIQLVNTDQSGIQLEVHSGRTLNFKGVYKVQAVAQSVNATTHSFTIQVIVSADGDVFPKTLVRLKETSMSKAVQQNMFKPDTFIITWKNVSTSERNKYE